MMRRFLIRLSRSRRIAGWAADSRLAWLGARRFVSGKTLAEAIEVVKGLNDVGMTATLDLLGEGVTNQAEAERWRDSYLRIMGRIRESGVHSGISLKLTSLGLATSYDLAERLLGEVVERAAGFDPPLYVRIDMEDSPFVQQTLDLFYAQFERHRNVGVVIQSYLYRSDRDIEDLIRVGAGVRMVKGAYLEPEDIAHQVKRDVDAAFIRQTERLMCPEARANGVYTAVATHDEAIIDWTRRYAAEEGIPRDAFEFQMLYGIRRDLQAALAADGYRVRIYVPYGRQWYPYYMRRMAEQPQNMVWVARGVLRESLSRG
jgi:proline dehydrogenase